MEILQNHIFTYPLSIIYNIDVTVRLHCGRKLNNFQNSFYLGVNYINKKAKLTF